MIENRDTSDFEVDETPIREFRGNNVINEVEFENNNTKKVDGVFIAIGTASSVDLARKIGAVIKGNNIVTNENMQTTVKSYMLVEIVPEDYYKLIKQYTKVQ